MKKILLSAAAIASMLFAASCQKEISSSVQDGDVVTATITVQAPDALVTKSVGDGKSADNLVFAVYDETGEELPALRLGDWANSIGDPTPVTFNEDLTATVTVQLARGKEYSFVCWAQNVEATCYNFSDMKNIRISYETYNASNNDLRDAFYAKVDTKGKVTQNFSQEITLHRPFGQINVGTTDFAAAKNAGLEITDLYSSMTVKNAATVLETFTGKAKSPEAVTFDWGHSPAEALVINKALVQNNPQVEIADSYGWLAMNYILVADGTDNGASSALAEVAFSVREGENTVLTSYEVPNVPVQRNFRTNIVGGLLTAEGEISIIIDPIFNGEYVINVWDGYTVEAPASDENGYYVTKASELAWVAQQVNEAGKTFENETVYLAADIDLAGQVWTPIGAGETAFKGTFEVLPNTSLLAKSVTEYYAIYGLNVDYTEGPAGLFGWLNGTVMNVTLVNPQVSGESCVAAVAGKIFNTGLVENCTVKGGIVYGNHYVAGIVGYSYGAVNYNTVDGTIITGESINEDLDGDKVGGIVGLHAGDAKTTVKGNKVLDVTVVAKRDAAAVAGAANASNVTENHVEKATVGSAEAKISDAGVVVGRVLAGALNPKANTYNHETITVNGKEVDPAVVEFNAKAASDEVLPVEGGQYVITVTANVPWTVTVPEGLTAAPAAGEGNAEVVVTVPATELTEPNPVTYEVVVATEEEAETKEYKFTIKQTAAEPAFKVVTVAEFLAAAEDKTMYQLTGVITSVTNTAYGNFYLKDATGEVLIYGLCSPEGAQKYWEASGAKVGDTITVQTVRTSYNNAPQGKDALFVELKPFVAQASEWGIVGDLNSWGNDINMVTTWHTENLFVAYNVEIASGAFKIRANKEWNDAKNYGLEVAGNIYTDKYYSVITSGGSQNITPMEYGKYDVYFDLTNKRVALMTPGKAYAEATDGGKPVVVVAGLKDHEWGLVGSFNGWDVANYVVTEVDGDWAVAKNVTLDTNAEFKFAADKAWTLSYGTGSDVNVGETYTTYNNGGNMKFVGEAGAYDVYFSLVDASFYMEQHKEKVEATSTLTFDDKAKRTTFNTNQQVWTENGVTVTNDKASSTNAVADYAKPARFYQGSKITVAVEGEISEIVFDCNSSSYATALNNSIGTTATVTVSSDKVTVTLDGASSFEIAKLTAQVRMDAVTVTYVK